MTVPATAGSSVAEVGSMVSGAVRAHSPAASRGAWLVALFAAWLAGSLYVFGHLPLNWLPGDDGMLAHSAERVLRGDMPHQDFAEVYTGGLSYLHAAAFKLFGVRLLSLRYMLFSLFVLWLPVVFYCASRFVGPLGAATATLLSALWTLPNYPAAMPSWYNLFFATFGAAALLRFAETQRRRWIFAAGMMGGCSILIKIVGLYYVAACLLYLTVHAAADPGRPAGRSSRYYRLAAGAGLALFVAALFGLIRNHLTVEYAYHFLLPGTMLAAFTWHAVTGADRSASLKPFWRLVWPFLLGAMVPLAGFMLPYALQGAVPALLRGVFVSPATRLASVSASRPPADWVSILPAVVLASIVMLAVRAGSGVRRWLALAPWVAVTGGLFAGAGLDYLDLFSWTAVAEATPVLVTAGVFVLARRWPGDPSAHASLERCFILLVLAGLCSLVAFPYAAPIYFCYNAPLALLALIALLRVVGGPPQPLSGLLAASYLTLAPLTLNAQSPRDVGMAMRPGPTLVPLRLRDAGIRVRADDADRYRSVVDTLLAHARGGVTYAGPDSPELYFLTGLRNPTRLIFDFLEPNGRQPDSLLALVDRERITAVMINHTPEYSRPLDARVLDGFAERFPHQWSEGAFTVRWE